MGGKTKEQKSLTKWTNQKWTTASGKNSIQGPKATGERYMPKAALNKLTKSELAATNKAKRDGIKKGKQYVANTPKAKKKITIARKA